MLRSAAFILAGMLAAGAAQAVTVEHVNPGLRPAGNPLNMLRGGRMEVLPDTSYLKHQWPGAYWEADFNDSEITVSFADPVNILHVYIDGKIVDTEVRPGRKDVRFSNLGNSSLHYIRVETATEGQGEAGSFVGFTVPKGANPEPIGVPRIHQIEFIGDSYTVGYGNTSPKRQCTQEEIWATTDTSQAFGPLTAKHYGADYQVNAISGRGIVRNYGGGGGDPLPVAYPYVLFDKKTKYNDPDWHPQIIVIGLGTNDFTTPLHAGEKWKTRDELHADYEATYAAFVKNLRVRNPNAFFILMATDQVEGEIQSEAKKVVSALQASGESRIVFLPMNGLGFEGCDWHPSTADDVRVSQSLITYIDAHPDVWQGK